MLFARLLVLSLLSLVSVSGQTLWLLGASGNWNTAANWGLNGIPLTVPPVVGQLVTAINAAGTYNVTVDVNVDITGTGSLTLGSDVNLGLVNPTLVVASSIKSFFATLTVQAGGKIVLNDGAELWVTNLQFTSANAASVVSGTGKIYVNGTLTYTANNGNLVLPVQVNTTGVTVGNGATVQLTSGGGCWGQSGAGSINLGSGNVVVTNNFDLGNCVLSGSGNLTLNSTNAQVYVLAQGNHAAGYVKVQSNAILSLSGGAATTVAANVWVGGSGARLVVQQSSASTVTQVNGDVQVVAQAAAQGSSNLAVNSRLVVSGALWLGSDTVSGVTPSVAVASNVWASVDSLRLASGSVALSANGGFAATTVIVTGSSATVNTISGAGWFNVTGSFTASTNGATVQVNSPFALTGSLTVTNNHTVVVNSNSGWASGSINLGGTGQGGNLVIQGAWSHTSAPSGGGGTIAFNPSTSINLALVAGTYAVAWVKAQNHAHVWVNAASATAISGALWIQDNAQVTVNQTLTVGQEITVTGSGELEVAGADVTAATVTFQSNARYVLFAANSNPPKLTTSGQATFAGTVHIVSQKLVDGTENVTVVAYASRTGAFGSVTAESSATVGMAAQPMYATSRRLLANSGGSYAVEYSGSSADAYRSGNGASSLSPSILLLGLIVSMMSVVLHLSGEN